MNVGTKLLTVTPIAISEFEPEWPVGTEVEIVQVRDDEPCALNYEIEGPNRSIGSFAAIDLEGEHAWFRPL